MGSAVDFDSADYADATMEWALEAGLWDGRIISWQNAPEFSNEATLRVINLLASQDPNSFDFNQMAANLARLGTTDPAALALLEKDIEELKLDPNGMVIQAGFGKWISKCWHKHKVAIIVGAAILAVAVTITVVTVCTGGAAAGAVAGGLAAGLSKKDEDKPAPQPTAPPQSLALPQETPLSTPPIPSINSQLAFLANGMQVGDQIMSYESFMQQMQLEGIMPRPSPNPEPSWLTQVLTKKTPWGHEIILPNQDNQPAWVTKSILNQGSETYTQAPVGQPAFDTKFSLERELWSPQPEMIPTPELSRTFKLDGIKEPHLAIGFINGINTKFEGLQSHGLYSQSLARGHAIDCVYNHSHGAPIDLLEVLSCNYLGYSPVTSDLLMKNWAEFHKVNKDNPDAKYFQICHSQGAIHVRNTLLKAPKEIRDRVIVLAIAPATVITDDLCAQSFNFASKNDPIPNGELLFLAAGHLDANNNHSTLGLLQQLYEKTHGQLIRLEPHPDATGIDHDFQSPTFLPIIKEIEGLYLSGELNNKKTEK